MPPKIAIVGAGPGGCMLARLLHQHSIRSHIFESEHSIDDRSQGGSLDLRAGTGLAAVKEAGLFDEFHKLARYDGESLLICDKKQTTWVRRQPGDPNRKNALQEAPEIDRVLLRKLLLDSLPENTVSWGWKLIRVDPDLTLHFSNGRVESGFDLVVGADGAWSKVRNLLSSEKPAFTGTGGYLMDIPPDAEVRAPRAYKFINRGSVFSFSDNKNINGQFVSDKSIRVSSWGVKEENWMETSDVNITDSPSVKAALKKDFHDWGPDLINLIDSTEGPVYAKNLYMLPVGFRWDHQKGVTLLGDAAHLMSPFAGIGVNTALYDAMLLSRSIIKAQASLDVESLDKCIIKYEESMWENAHKAQELSYNSMKDMLFIKDAPRASIERWILRHAKAEVSRWTYPFVAAAVYIGFFFYKLFV